MNKLIKTSFSIILLISSFTLHAKRIDYGEFSIEQLKEQATSIHPAGLYILASKLFKKNKKNDAVFWLTVGHLRFKFHLATKPSTKSIDGPTLFSTLQNFIGGPINDYAGIDADLWASSAKKAKQWDLNNTNAFTSKIKYKKEYTAIHLEMDDMINYIIDNKVKIQEDRKQSALKNKK